jgi:hypothetical protein
VTWYFCRLRDGGCQRTLELEVSAEAGTVVASVRAYDDQGRGGAVEGATVTAGAVTGLTDATGEARLAVGAGSHRVVAERAGTIRSFAERVEVP